MPSAAEHELKSEHNWSFVSFVEGGSTSFDDWVVTGLFYVAVHQVERLLAKKANKTAIPTGPEISGWRH